MTLGGLVFQVKTIVHKQLLINNCLSTQFVFLDPLSLPLLNQFPFPYMSVTPMPSFKFKHLSLLALIWAFFFFQTFCICPVHVMLQTYWIIGAWDGLGKYRMFGKRKRLIPRKILESAHIRANTYMERGTGWGGEGRGDQMKKNELDRKSVV